ncbi:MAG TPA: transcriptional regulator [Chloroflexia bacterium]|nr:transcriptional regulator [Chloroflexia bacterium]
MNGDLRQLTAVDRVIHEPARLLIVAILSAAESADFLYLLRETGLTKGNLSAHLARLEQSHYVEIEKSYRGKIPQTRCRLTPAGRAAFTAYHQQLRQLMAQLPPGGPPPDS